VVLEFTSAGELVVEDLPHLLEVSEGMAQKRVEPVGDDSLEAGREHPAHEIIVRVDRQLVLVVPKMLDGVWCS